MTSPDPATLARCGGRHKPCRPQPGEQRGIRGPRDGRGASVGHPAASSHVRGLPRACSQPERSGGRQGNRSEAEGGRQVGPAAPALGWPAAPAAWPSRVGRLVRYRRPHQPAHCLRKLRVPRRYRAGVTPLGQRPREATVRRRCESPARAVASLGAVMGPRRGLNFGGAASSRQALCPSPRLRYPEPPVSSGPAEALPGRRIGGRHSP